MDVISAISTPAGCGGVAIIRLSGSSALKIAENMFIPAKKIRVADFLPNYMYAGEIECEGFKDFGMCVYFKAPKSFTGEDVVEFHCHGGVQIARGVLSKTIALGARAAEKGEFTKRAFINGKLTLSSAEGMIDMINAESLAELRAGSMMYTEKLTRDVRAIQSALKDVLAAIAVEMDYPEEDSDGVDFKEIKTKISAVSKEISALASTYSCGRLIKNGVTVAICGKPNAGKSSLLNRLLGYDKAIVSSQAGTTRDAVEGAVEIDGVKFNLIDTAGIREGVGEIESIGIERAKNLLQTADVVLSLSDGSGEIVPETKGEVVKVFTKSDIAKPDKEYDAVISSKTGEGIELLKRILSRKALGEFSLDKAYIIEKRHYSALERAKNAIDGAMENLENSTCDLLSVDLTEAWQTLGEITGETANERIIDVVFSKFCVGK